MLPRKSRRQARLGLALALSVLSAVCLTPRLVAADPAASDTEVVKTLAARVEALEKELKEIKANGPAPAAEATAEPAAEEDDTWPKIKINLFADINYHTANSNGAHNHFEMGEFDIFLKSRISEKADILAETVLSADQTNNWGLDVERLLFEYHVNSSFNVGAGRFHTALGYYNNTFHHGTWFQTATGRPSFLEFEDSGGLLPVHSVGLTINGEIPSGTLGLRYFAEVGNGRAFSDPLLGKNEVQNHSDNNSGKAFNFELIARPEFVAGLQFGTGYYLDRLSPTGQPNTREGIWDSFVVFKNAEWEFLSEYYAIRHQPDGAAATNTTAWFVQLARQFGKFRPYARYTFQNVPLDDAAYTLQGLSGKQNGPSLGIRWDFETYAALKAQYDAIRVDRQSTHDDLTLQLAFTF